MTVQTDTIEGTTRVENDRRVAILTRVQDACYDLGLCPRSLTIVADAPAAHTLHLYRVYQSSHSSAYASPHHVEALASQLKMSIVKVTSYPDYCEDGTGRDPYATWVLRGSAPETGAWELRIFAAMPTETGADSE